MWNTSDVILSFIMGFFFAIFLFFILSKQSTKSHEQELEDAERKDPANWWKYKQSPYDEND